MTYDVTVLSQGFLLPEGSVPETYGDPFAIVVPGLAKGVAYTRVRVERAELVVVFCFDADEEHAVAAAAAGIAARFADASVVHAQRLSVKQSVARARLSAAGPARVAVAGACAATCASMPSALSQVTLEHDGRTYRARAIDWDGGYRVEVEESPADAAEPEQERPAADPVVALLERVTAKLSKGFADPERAALYRAALCDLGIAHLRAGERDKGTAALRLCASLFDLVFVPTEQDRELRRRVEAALRGAPTLDFDVQRWTHVDEPD